MCSCNLRQLAQSPHPIYCGDLSGHLAKIKEARAAGKLIQLQDLMDHKPLAICQTLWCYNEQKFRKAFSDIGLDLTYEELPQFCEIVSKGGDAKGAFMNSQGKPITFNFLQVIGSINYTTEEIRKNECNLGLCNY